MRHGGYHRNLTEVKLGSEAPSNVGCIVHTILSVSSSGFFMAFQAIDRISVAISRDRGRSLFALNVHRDSTSTVCFYFSCSIDMAIISLWIEFKIYRYILGRDDSMLRLIMQVTALACSWFHRLAVVLTWIGGLLWLLSVFWKPSV